MSYSGSTLYRKISGFRRELESNISTRTARGLDLSTRSRQLLSKQAELWTSLANIHLNLGFDLPKEINALVARRKDRLENQLKIVEVGDRRIMDLIGLHKDREEELLAAQTAFDEHESILRAKFEADAVAMALSVTVLGLKFSVDIKRERFSRVEAECTTKVEAYEADEFFRYLRKRGYGTDGYSSTGFISRLDHWVSRLVGYDKAVADYEHLLKIPGWHSDDLEQAVALLADAAKQLDDVQNKAFATLVPYKNKLRDAGKALDAAAEAISDEHHKIAAAQRTLSEASIAQDEDFKKIKRELANTLERINIRDLQELAKRTETTEDDVIVKKIIQNRNDLADIESQSNTLAREIAALKQRATEFEVIESKMRRNSWHHSDHSFSGNMDTQLANMLLGVVTADAVWRAMSNAHREPAPSYRESITSSPWSSSESSWSSSSSSSSSYSTGGGSGGGDYSTGGGV